MWPWALAAGQWVLRLVGGWLPLGNKPIGEWLGKILWAVGIFAICFFVVTRFTGCKKKPIVNPPNNTAGGSIVYVQPHFGCATIKVNK
jgi:hypothetical protein